MILESPILVAISHIFLSLNEFYYPFKLAIKILSGGIEIKINMITTRILLYKIINQDTSHMKKVDQRVTAIDAKAYVHSMITEHSLSPAPNNSTIVPDKL